MAGVQNAGEAPRGREEMFKRRLLSLPVEKWRESIIMKNAFILSCHSSFFPPPEKKHTWRMHVCVGETGWRYVSHSTRTNHVRDDDVIIRKPQFLQYVSWMIRKVKPASRRLLDDDWQAAVISHSHAWLHCLHPSSSSSLTFSSVWLKWRGVQAHAISINSPS